MANVYAPSHQGLPPNYQQYMQPAYSNSAISGVGLYTGTPQMFGNPQQQFSGGYQGGYQQQPQIQNYGSFGANPQFYGQMPQQQTQYSQYPQQMNPQYIQPQPSYAQNPIYNPNYDDAQLLMKNIVTQTTDALNDRDAFENFLQQFEQEYRSKNAQRDRTPSPLRRTQSNPLIQSEQDPLNRSQRSRSPSPMLDRNQVPYQSQFSQQNYKDFLPTQNEKQRLLYTDPHTNSQGLLMNDRKNEPLNFQDLQSQQQINQFTQRESPTRTARTFYDQADTRSFNIRQQHPISEVNRGIQINGGFPDTIGSMRKSLEKYELNKQPYVPQQRSVSPNQQLSQNFNQQMQLSQHQQSRSFYGNENANYSSSSTILPSMNSYQRDEQKTRIMQIVNQPQLKTTLSSSQFMRSLREQSLRQIQNWDYVQKDYEDKKNKLKQEQQQVDPKKVAQGNYGQINPTMSANSFMNRH